MTAGGHNVLRALEALSKALALFARQELLKSRHVLVLFVFNVVVEVFEEGLEQRQESGVDRGHILQFIKSVLDLFTKVNILRTS